LALLLLAVALGSEAQATTTNAPPPEVVVLYNRALADSKDIALHYATRRDLPTNHIVGLDLPTTENMSRDEFTKKLQRPLLDWLTAGGWFQFQPVQLPAGSDQPARTVTKLTRSRVRYLVACFGVPVRIDSDAGLSEPGMDKVRPELRRNGASVDSELALLPIVHQTYLLAGPIGNVFYGVTNAFFLHPTNGLLMVTRLDGPTAPIARALVDKALDAETNGLWGRAYFDTRGLTNTSYKLGDDWIRNAAQLARRFGFETVLDEKPETFPASFPVSQVALYAGWYDTHASGPFAQPKPEFMPGAIAYHLHSYSAASIRSSSQHWVGPLLARGVAATMGCVDEPYLEGTPDVAMFVARLFRGFTFGEAAYAAQNALSWQATIVGDPLYRPFGSSPQSLHEQLEAAGSQRLEWSHLLIVNRNLAVQQPPTLLLGYLENQPITQRSAVLQEKIATLHTSQGKLAEAIDAYVRVLRLEPSPQQRLRVLLDLARLYQLYSRPAGALELYEDLVRQYPAYPGLASVYAKLQTLATELGRTSEASRFARELEKLNPTAQP
jgi:uncharacterized protein (TIGR03790 family)